MTVAFLWWICRGGDLFAGRSLRCGAHSPARHAEARRRARASAHPSMIRDPRRGGKRAWGTLSPSSGGRPAPPTRRRRGRMPSPATAAAMRRLRRRRDSSVAAVSTTSCGAARPVRRAVTTTGAGLRTGVGGGVVSRRVGDPDAGSGDLDVGPARPRPGCARCWRRRDSRRATTVEPSSVQPSSATSAGDGIVDRRPARARRGARGRGGSDRVVEAGARRTAARDRRRLIVRLHASPQRPGRVASSRLPVTRRSA